MPAALHTVDVRPPSAHAESWGVGRAAFHILFWSALVISAEARPSASAEAAASPPSPFEVRFADLDAADQREFRAVQEGVVEAERRRSSDRKWPSAEALARELIPPFAPDPLDRAGYSWTFAQKGLITNYLGTPRTGSGKQAFLIILVEPNPGTPSDPSAVVDETHHKLGDGTFIHATIWMGPGLSKPSEPVSWALPDPGWKQVVVTAAR